MSSGPAAAAQSKTHWYWAHRYQLFFRPRRITERRKVENQPNHRLPFNIPLFQYSNFSGQVDIIAQAAKFFMTTTLKINLTGSRQNASGRIRHRKKREPNLDFRMICDPEEFEGVEVKGEGVRAKFLLIMIFGAKNPLPDSSNRCGDCESFGFALALVLLLA